MSIRVALVNKDTYRCLLIANTLGSKGFEITQILHTFSQLSQALEAAVPDVLIISFSEDAVNEIALVEKVRSKNPRIGLVFLTSTPDLRLLGLVEKELPKGAQVIFKKSITDLHILSRAIYDAIDTSKISSPVSWVTGNSFTDGSESFSTLSALTQVQIETLRLVAQGRSNAEIAQIRFVTEKAVEHTITRLLSALNITSNPRNNSRVMLAREYYRWVEVPKAKV